MANKKIFTIDGSSINKMFSGFFGSIMKSRVIATSKKGNNIFRLPLIFAIIIAIIFPVALILAIIIGIALQINVSIEREILEEQKLLNQKNN